MLRTLPLALALVLAAPLAAQDQDYFGAAVAFSGQDLLVVKRSPARGPAAIHVFSPGTSGSWAKRTELRAPNAVEHGLALSPSIVATPDGILVGAGDPYGQWGAHAWTRTVAGWADAPGLEVGTAPEGTPVVSLGTIMAVLQPKPRSIAERGGTVIVGYDNAVRIFRRRGDRFESVPVTLPAEVSTGAAVALGPGQALAGVPLTRGGRGSVRVLVTADGQQWADHGALEPDGFEGTAMFGSAIAFDDSIAAIGAPGAATVVIYRRQGDDFVESQRLAPGAVAGFGGAIALHGNELLVGAGRGGAAYRFRLRGGSWTLTDRIAPPPGADTTSFGSSVALGDAAIAVGAPSAVGGRGRVWVFARRGAALGRGVELGPDPGPQTMTAGEVRCANGAAGRFDCDNVDLESFLTIASLGGAPTERVSDIWGWTDPVTDHEYALIGRTGALVFVDITDASAPRVVGQMPANPSGARDIKVFRDHAFLTGDGAGDHGLMVFDLTRLRGVTGAPRDFTPDAVYHGIASAHNLVIDTASALAIPVAASSGGNTCGGGLHLVDIREPKAPKFAGCFTDTEGLIAPGRTHDAQCVKYHGPDARYRDKSVCFASNETALRIVDVSDPAHPVALGRGSYPGAAYIHQGWLTDDHRLFYLDDELDEVVGITGRTRTMIWDVSDLEDPVMIGTYLGPDGATDHNLFVRGDRMYQANYQAGLRVVDISDPRSPREVGHFDTTPYEGNAAGFYGAWGVYPYFKSGAVIVSSMQEGLFVLKPRPKAVP